MLNGLSNARQKGESFEDYKHRRKTLNRAIKERLKGKTVWFSKYQGTYRYA